MSAPLARPSLPGPLPGAPALASRNRREAQRRLDAAIDTMMRAVAFLHARASIIEQGGNASAPQHAMMLANALRELDRFLHVLLNELASVAGLDGSPLRAFRRGRNAATKLAAYPALFGARVDDFGPLLMFREQKSRLTRIFAYRRPVGAACADDRMTRITPPQIDLAAIGAFYADLTVRLVAHVLGADRADRSRAA